MEHPKTIPAFFEAAREWQPPLEISEPYHAAVFASSPVTASVAVLRLLKDREGLDQDGLRVLIGAAWLISRPNNQWHGMGSAAAQVLANRASELLLVSGDDAAP